MKCSPLMKEALEGLDTAARTVLKPLDSKLKKLGFTKEGNSNQYINKEYLDQDSDEFNSITLIPESNTLLINAGGFEEGSSQGKKFYFDIWNLAELEGLKTSPESLSSINEIRMTANQLQYMESRNWVGAPHVGISSSQWGTLHLAPNSTLTKENALLLAEGFKNKVNRLLLFNYHDLDDMTPKEVVNEISNRLGKREGVHIGKKTINLLVKLLKDKDIKSVGAIGLLLIAQEDFKKLVGVNND